MIAHYHVCERCGAAMRCSNEACTEDELCSECAAKLEDEEQEAHDDPADHSRAAVA